MPLSRGRAEDIFIGFCLIFLVVGVVLGWVLPVYTDNFVSLKTGPNVSVTLSGMPSGTVNCTGITTAGLTARKSDTVLVVGTYTAASLNVTDWTILVIAHIGTVQPVTVFGSGFCSSTITRSFGQDLFFPVSGSANFKFSATFSFTFTAVKNTVYYAWFDINTIGLNIGHVNLESFGSNAFSSLTMREIPS